MDDSYKELENILRFFDEASESIGVDYPNMYIVGGSYSNNLVLGDRPLWESDEDVREFDDEKNEYKTSIVEATITDLEDYVAYITKLVEAVKKIVKAEALSKVF